MYFSDKSALNGVVDRKKVIFYKSLVLQRHLICTALYLFGLRSMKPLLCILVTSFWTTFDVVIDPLTLFLRLVVVVPVVERKPENEIVDFFEYEKSKLKSCNLNKVQPTKRTSQFGQNCWQCCIVVVLQLEKEWAILCNLRKVRQKVFWNTFRLTLLFLTSKINQPKILPTKNTLVRFHIWWKHTTSVLVQQQEKSSYQIMWTKKSLW
jgi:hypothetical protein